MDRQEVLYIIGLVLVSLYLIMGTDDVIWDLVSLVRRFTHKDKHVDPEQLNAIPPKLLAVAVAAWHEDNVLGDVITNMLESVQYPRSMYHVFLGVYPNDAETIAVAEALSEKYHNVHVIINELPGPTSKAQNLNYVIKQIHEFEMQHGWEFQALTVHDSEDVIHPEELKLTNYLLDTYPAIQYPVFPLMEMPKFRNFFKNITTNTYADEFAENHYTAMVNRRKMGAFVPSAGTGFVLSRQVIESFGGGDVLPRDSLTEDYRLSLTLYEMGIPLYYALEKVPRLNDAGKMKWDYVATRSRFPDTYRAAVKQKTRWILGITMQSFKFKDVIKTKKLKFAAKYTLYKDSKAKIGNLLSMVGYPVLIYFLVSLFVPLIPIYPKYSRSWWLSVVVTCMMIERQLFRGIALYHIYGMRTVFFSILFPPLFPLRLIWGNIINLHATVRAYIQYFSGNGNKKEKKIRKKEAKALEAKKKEAAQPAEGQQPKPVKWAKTDHAFLEKSVLKRYHRNVGDILLQRCYITPDQLRDALENKEDELLGSYLIRTGVITEAQLQASLASATMTPYIVEENLSAYPLDGPVRNVTEDIMDDLSVVPMKKIEDGYVFGFTTHTPLNAREKLSQTLHTEIYPVYILEKSMKQARAQLKNPLALRDVPETSAAGKLLHEGQINYEQYILIRNYAFMMHKDERELLPVMGLSQQPAEVAAVL